MGCAGAACACGADADGAAGDVRLNAEFMGGDAIAGAAVGAGAGAGADGMERSRRSPRPDADAAGLDGACEEKEEKSARLLDGLVVRFCA